MHARPQGKNNERWRFSLWLLALSATISPHIYRRARILGLVEKHSGVILLKYSSLHLRSKNLIPLLLETAATSARDHLLALPERFCEFGRYPEGNRAHLASGPSVSPSLSMLRAHGELDPGSTACPFFQLLPGSINHMAEHDRLKALHDIGESVDVLCHHFGYRRAPPHPTRAVLGLPRIEEEIVRIAFYAARGETRTGTR